MKTKKSINRLVSEYTNKVRKFFMIKSKSNKRICILLLLFLLGLVIYAIYKPTLKVPVFEHLYNDLTSINLITNNNFKNGKDLGKGINDNQNTNPYTKYTMFNSSGSDGNYEIVTKSNPADSEYVLKVAGVLDSLVTNITSKYLINIDNRTNNYKHFVLSAWVYIEGDHSDIKLFNIKNYGQYNQLLHKYETSGLYKESVTYEQNIWKRYEVIFEVENVNKIFTIAFGNIPKGSLVVSYFTEISLSPFLLHEPTFPLYNGLVTYINLNNEFSYLEGNNNLNSLIHTKFFNKLTSDEQTIYSPNNLPTVAPGETLKSLVTYKMGTDDILNTINEQYDNIVNFTLLIKIAWNSDYLVSDTGYELFNYKDITVGSTKSIQLLLMPLSSSNNKVVGFKLIINGQIIENNQNILEFDTSGDIVIIIICSGDNGTIINIYINGIEITLKDGHNSISTISNFKDISFDMYISGKFDNKNVISKLALYKTQLDYDQINTLYNYFANPSYEQYTSTERMLTHDVSDYTKIFESYLTYPEVKFINGEYIVTVHPNTQLSNDVSYYGTRSYGNHKAKARDIFIANFSNLSIPKIMQEGYFEPINTASCPFVINNQSSNNPCHTENCYNVNNWAEDELDYTTLTPGCKKDIHDYCSINKNIDDNCKCWRDEYKNTDACKTFRNNLYLDDYSFTDSDITKHPNFNRYIPKDMCNCSAVDNTNNT
jgi:hypothetical protein